MTNTNNYSPRIRAWQIARTLTTSKIIWAGHEGGDHIFTTPAGAEIRVDLVLGTARHG